MAIPIHVPNLLRDWACIVTVTTLAILGECLIAAAMHHLGDLDLSLAAPAIAALTYIGNAIVAKLFLGENVDRRRWLAASFVTVGVVLLSR